MTPDEAAKVIGRALFPNSKWEWIPPLLREKLENAAQDICGEEGTNKETVE